MEHYQIDSSSSSSITTTNSTCSRTRIDSGARKLSPLLHCYVYRQISGCTSLSTSHRTQHQHWQNSARRASTCSSWSTNMDGSKCFTSSTAAFPSVDSTSTTRTMHIMLALVVRRFGRNRGSPVDTLAGSKNAGST